MAGSMLTRQVNDARSGIRAKALGARVESAFRSLKAALLRRKSTAGFGVIMAVAKVATRSPYPTVILLAGFAPYRSISPVGRKYPP